ncbi:MAG TPA: hypothetical protein VGQ00_04185 [Candidatus Norongarragalinales archaeon]|jgi:hypothetical protein|nr:hypothetical protein [Candidatus Norongarragalinales archaeon]
MTESVSNVTLAVLILAALAISIAGTYMVLNKPAVQVSGISGAIIGNATFNVTAISSIKFFNSTFALVNFGNINVTDCSPWFVSGSNTTPPCYNNTEDDNPNPFVIENDGGNKVNVTSQFSGLGFSSSNSYWSWKLANTSCYHARNTPTGACFGQANGPGVRFPAEADSFDPRNITTLGINLWQNFSGSSSFNSAGATVNFLNFTDSNDTFMFDIGVAVGGDESAGMHNMTATFTATSSGTGP